MLTKTQKKALAGFLSTLEGILSEVETIDEGLTEKIDAKSEKWHEGEAAAVALTEQEAVQSFRENVQSAIDALGEIEFN